MLFHDLPEEEAERLASLLPKQPYACFSTPVQWDPYRDDSFRGCFGYILTETDRILVPELQRMRIDIPGFQNTVVLKGSFHSPHIEIPQKLAETTIELLDIIHESSFN